MTNPVFKFISGDTMRRCAYLHSLALESALRKTYPEDKVLRSEFLGISNGEHFVYKIVYPGFGGVPKTAKVFVWEDKEGELIADYANC